MSFLFCWDAGLSFVSQYGGQTSAVAGEPVTSPIDQELVEKVAKVFAASLYDEWDELPLADKQLFRKGAAAVIPLIQKHNTEAVLRKLKTKANELSNMGKGSDVPGFCRRYDIDAARCIEDFAREKGIDLT